MVYGYARCSTNDSKQDIARQKRELKTLGVEEIYWEYESGTKLDRPELNKVIKRLEQGDSLVVTEISRITRSTRQLCDIIDLAAERRIKLVIGGFVVNCINGIDIMTEGMLKMMGVFAELERKMIIERVRSGLANARAKGVRLGRPLLTADKLPAKFLDYLQLYHDGHISKTDYARLCDISRPTLYKYIAIAVDK